MHLLLWDWIPTEDIDSKYLIARSGKHSWQKKRNEDESEYRLLGYREPRKMRRVKFFHIRLSDEEDKLFEDISQRYRLDRSSLFRYMLKYTATEKPTFQIKAIEEEK